jgi:competence protein ComEC
VTACVTGRRVARWWGKGQTQGRTDGRTETWPPGGARALAGPRALGDFADTAAARLRGWAAAEAVPGRLLPWLPVAFGLGIAIYFTAEREPIWWAALALAGACAAIAFLARRRPVAFPITLVVAIAATGFAVAALKTHTIAHPVLQAPAGNVEIAGFVESREERERSDRIVVRALKLEGLRSAEKPERVRVSVRKGTAPPVGTHVTFRARLNPPLTPLRPGGYDFARDLYFQKIGAVGFVLGAIRISDPGTPRGLWLGYASVVEGIRDAINARIRAVVPGDRGAIASALITGKRDAISSPVNDAMYVSSLAHVLSISGYHMAVVAGVIFFVLRALFALVPVLAIRHPIKKWAALAALITAAVYLVISGAEVATQRAFIMTAIVLVGVMADRAALTLRTLAVAAFAVLIVAPQAVIHPSFQMSFAATLALVAAYETNLRWQPNADTTIGARVALWGGAAIAGLVLASLVAGLATTPYAAYHFHRMAPYGVLANLVAMPIVSLWVMPAGLLALVAIPFGFDGYLWRLMGEGIDWMIAVALWTASLPGAVGRIPAFGMGTLLVGTAGLVLLCLLKTPLRWSGALVMVLAGLWALGTPQPDVLVAADGQTLAVRGADGRLSILRQGGGDAFTARQWLAADGDERAPAEPALRQGFTCDPSGCVTRLPDGRTVSYVLTPDAFAEDCARASLIVTARNAPPRCAATVVDRQFLQASGAISLARRDNGWSITAARPPGQDRPWARATAAPPESALPSSRPARPQPRDATPRLEDLESGDQ